MFRQIRKKSVDSICDIYLRCLYKLERKNKFPEGLPLILAEKRIFYDSSTIDLVIKKLLSSEYIETTEDICAFTYGRKDYNLGIFKKKPSKKSIHEEILSDDFIENIEGRIIVYKLTKQGRSFIQNNQYLDTEVLEKKKKCREKFVEKIVDNIFVIIITIITSIITTIITTLITVYLTKK